MVIIAELENYSVKKVLIDQGNSVDILYWTTYQKLQLPLNVMIPYDEPIYIFSGEKVSTRGYVDLHTIFRDKIQTKTIHIRFLIVDACTLYNVFLGRPSLNTLGAVVSMPPPSHENPLLRLVTSLPSTTTNDLHENATWLAYVLNSQFCKQTTWNVHPALT